MTANFFDMLGVGTAIGRPFTAAEAAAERQPRVAVLSHRFWQRRFNGTPTVVGERLTLNNASFDIVGVLPESYRAVSPTDDFDLYFAAERARASNHRQPQQRNALGVLGASRPGERASRRKPLSPRSASSSSRPIRRTTTAWAGPRRWCRCRSASSAGWQEPLVISAVAVDPVRPGAPERLRQCGRPAAGARRAATARDRRSYRAWRQARRV